MTVDVGRGPNGDDVTKHKKVKQAARVLSQSAGIPYTAARRALAAGGSAGGPGGGTGPGDDGWDDYEPMSLTELLASSLQEACDRLISEDIRPRGDNTPGGISISFDLPADMSEPSVYEFDVNEKSVIVYVDETFEGGTVACNVTAEATLAVEAIMAKADAYASEAAGLVRISEPEFNNHYAAVHFDFEVEMTFLAIANPEYESVESLVFDGATALGS